MINLIPPTAQAQVVTEYWLRVISVWLFLLGTVILVIAILNVPAYVLVHNQLDTYLQEFTNATTNKESFTAAELSITRTNTIATLLAKPAPAISFTKLVSELEKSKSPGIIIFDFSLIKVKDAIDTITVTGQADSRATLSTFRDTLDMNPLFGKVTLPLSSLAKDKEIPFTITIAPDNQKTP